MCTLIAIIPLRYCFIFTGLVVLKKHYDNLMTSVPKDYKIIIHMLSSLSGKSDDEVIASQGHLIAASLRLKESSAQEMILHSMIVYARNDYRLLGFSYLLENATQDPNSAAIESFRNGWLEFNNTIDIELRIKAIKLIK